MDEGLLWFDADPNRPLAEKVARGADRYRYKFGRRPDLCYVNPATLDGVADGALLKNNIRLIASQNVLRNHFWIGISTVALDN